MGRLFNGYQALGRYGPGGDGNRPEWRRWIQFRNYTGLAVFIPDRSQAERTGAYNSYPHGSYSGGNATNGAYGTSFNRRLYRNTAIIGNGPCWNNNSNSANYRTPAGCPSGYSDAGVVYRNSVQPNSQSGRGGVQHGDVAWMWYFTKDYGCSGSAVAKISVRQCYRNNNYNI